ncbi:hypothetical protein D3C84_1225000 [compost metagenome]
MQQVRLDGGAKRLRAMAAAGEAGVRDITHGEALVVVLVNSVYASPASFLLQSH